MEISPELMTQLITAIIALITTIVAILKTRQVAAVTAEKTGVVQQVAAYIPGSEQSKDPEIIDTLPRRSWKMSDSTKRWLTFDASPENKASILQQIEVAETERLVSYQIRFDGGYYEIEYGLLKGGAGNPHDTTN